MKKRFALLLAIALLAIVPAGCAGGNGDPSSAPSSPISSNAANSPAPAEILAAIQAAYGDDYLATMEMPDEMFEGEFPLDKSLIQDKAAQMPAMSVHPDRVVVIRAVPGKGAEVEKALQAARERFVSDSIQYPMNAAKVQASQVVRNGDTAAFLLVGGPNGDPDADEAEALQFAKNETKKAVDAFYGAFS